MSILTTQNQIKKIFLEGGRPYLWIVCLIFLIYAHTISFGFTGLDDNQLILENYNFVSDFSNVGEAFQHPVFSKMPIPYYRPLLTTSFMIDAQIAGPLPISYHLTNILIHAAASCLVYLLLVTMGYRKMPAVFFSMIFAVHPVLAQAAAWIPGRNDSLLALFSLASFITLIKYRTSGSPFQYLFHIISLGLALFTKESAVCLVPLFAFYLYLLQKPRPRLKETAGLIASWLAIIAFWLILREAALTRTAGGSLFDMAIGLWKSLPVFVQYIGKIIMPLNLSVLPTIQDTAFIYGWMSIVIVILALSRSRKKRTNYILFGLAWFLCFLVVVFIRPTHKYFLDFQEHRLYLPMVGFIIILLEIDFFKGLETIRSSAAAFLALGILVFSFLTYNHCRVFKDNMSFWDDAVTHAPNSSVVHMIAGADYYKSGFIDKAETEYGKALSLRSDIPMLNLRLGLLYMGKNRFNDAEAAFKREILHDPFIDYAYLCLGVIYYKEGKLANAEAMWKKTLWVNPHNTDAMKNLAIFFYQKKDIRRAAYYAKRLIEYGKLPPAEFMKAVGLR